MQIIAKAILTFLGLSAFTNFCHNLTMLPSSIQAYDDASVLRVALSLPLAIIFITAVVYVFIFKNDWLVYKIAGSDETLDRESETLWLTASLRMVALFYGLILLSSSITTILNTLALPFYLRPLINEILTFKAFPKSLALTHRWWSSTVYDFTQAVLAVYLLCGWPQFIRYQLSLRKSELSLDKELNVKAIKNE